MMLQDIFIGPLRHWLMLALMIAALWLMGVNQFHIADFKLYLLSLFMMSTAAVCWVVFTYRRGERITRDPLERED